MTYVEPQWYDNTIANKNIDNLLKNDQYKFLFFI